MEDIDIENLDFEVYNREIYQDREKKFKITNKENIHKDALKKIKIEIDAFVEEYNRKNKFYEENINKKKINAIQKIINGKLFLYISSLIQNDWFGNINIIISLSKYYYSFIVEK